jgi:hypothetical protein
MKHNIIKTENYLLVVDDSYIKEGNWYFDSTDKAALNPIYKRGQDLIEEYYGCKKIIAHLPLNNSPIIEGVDLLPPLEDDVEKLAEQEYPISKGGSMWMPTRFDLDQSNRQEGFVRGYNKAKECFKYTEEDLRKAIEMAKVMGHGDSATYPMPDVYDEEEIIQSIQQPKYPVAFKCETEPMNLDEIKEQGKGFLNANTSKPKTTTNSQGQTVWVGTYKYE